MNLELSKKQFNLFINEIPLLLKSLEEKVEFKNKSQQITFCWEEIETVESYFKNLKQMDTQDVKEFWAYVGEVLRFYVGGEYRLASKSEDVAFTPIIINYGYKQKWEIRLSAEVWRLKLRNNTLPKKLVEHIRSINEKYGKN